MIKNIDIYSEMNKNYKLDKENKITGYATIDKPWQKYYSKEAITASIPELTAYQYMVSENQDNLNTKAIEYYGKKITYKNFIDMIDETSRRLYNLGIIEGEVITVISIANPELEVLFYALNKLGAVINLIDVRSDYKQIKKYLTEVKSSTVVVMDNFLPEFDKCMEDEDIDNIVENVITLSPYNSVLFPFNVLAEKKSRKEDSTLYSKIDEIKKKNKYMTWNDLMNVPKYRYSRYPRYKKNMVAALVHTGGTTGTPKTVKLSNENFNAMVLQFQAFNTYIKADTFLNDIVPFVAYGILGAIHMPLCLGLTNIIAPILSPQEFTEFMIKYKPNNVLAVPTYWENYKNDERVNNILVTSFNEWMAIKQPNATFVDVYNEEFSRDIEMMKGGYNDNFYMQLVKNVREFKYTPFKEYKKNNFTIDIENGVDSLWDAIHSGYQDFEGDAIKRDSVGAVNGLRYTDNSARNDIKLVKVTNDVKNIYFYIECKEDITTYNGTDENYMNIWLRTNSKDPSFNGFNILINRNIKNNEGTIEKSLGGYNFEVVGKAKLSINGNVMQVKIPKEYLNCEKENSFEFKVADNVTNYKDIMDYYVTGDVVPLGRLRYGY